MGTLTLDLWVTSHAQVDSGSEYLDTVWTLPGYTVYYHPYTIQGIGMVCSSTYSTRE